MTEHLDAIYTPKPAATQAAPTEGANMRRLREESTRLLGNGTCTRPALLYCRYETICETCTHFSTNDSHRQTITDQAGNAAARGEPDESSRTAASSFTAMTFEPWLGGR